MDTINILAIESSCDETAVAILRAPREECENRSPELLSSIISSQIAIHREYGGVVPELASRNHSADLPHLVRQACKEAGIEPHQIDACSATAGPGLVAALLIGNSTAKALALALDVPFIAVNHLEGHLMSPFITMPKVPYPHIGLVVSGGHTLFVEVSGRGQYKLMGRSLDDAAGEAFDKVGKMLGLPYPGGPEIDKRAALGNPKAFDFPRALMKSDEPNVSFSGLKTSVLYTLPKLTPTGNPADLTEDTLNDLCASFQQAVIDVLIRKSMQVLETTGCNMLALSGGVSCNSGLRRQLEETCDQQGIRLILPENRYTTDNAAMIAFVALLKMRQGISSPLNEDVNPNLSLTGDMNRSKSDRSLNTSGQNVQCMTDAKK